MRDLKPTDRVTTDGRAIIDEHGSMLPLSWNGVEDWARWWLRQAELCNVEIPEAQRIVLEETARQRGREA